jgi:hypothetical protein
MSTKHCRTCVPRSGNNTFRPENMYYVAINGNDATGDGSYSKPWQTIQHAIDQLEAIPLTVSTQAVINLAPGHYAEDLVFTNGYISIVSPLNANDTNEIVEVGGVIGGNVTINITSGTADLFNKQVIFQGIQFSGTITDTSTIPHTLLLQDCYIYANGRALYQNSSADNRTRVYNCQVQTSAPGTTNPCMEIASGDAYLDRVDFSSNVDAPVLKVSGTGVAFASLCDFTCTSTRTTSPGIKIVHITSSRLSTFGNSLFRFTENVAKTNANGFYCLFFEPTTASFVTVLYCVFAPTGIAATLPGPITQYVASTNLTGSINHGGCYSGFPNSVGFATTIGGIKFALPAIS